jgi:uncharacterized protein involved in exopolysaccharide biosynthesis
MVQTGTKQQREEEVEPQLPRDADQLVDYHVSRERFWRKVRQLSLKRRFLFQSAAIGLLCATVVAFLIPKRYTSTAQLMPPDSQPGSTLALVSAFTGQGGSLGALTGDMLGLKSTGALFIGVLRSRTVQDEIVAKFELKKIYGSRAEWAARQRLEENTAVSEDRKSGIITLSVTDRDPKRAAAIAGAYVAELDAIITQLATSSAHRERVFLEERLATVKADLGSAEKNFSQFASKTGAVDISAQGKATVEAAATLEGQLIAAQSELKGLKQIYTESNLRVRATGARIAELRHQLEKLAGPTDSAPKGELTTTDDLYPSLRRLPVLGVPYADLYRNMKVEEVVFETLTKEYELAKVQEAKEVPTVKVLDAPEIPERKSFPPRLQIMLLGAFLGVSFAACWVLAQAHWQAIAPEHPAKQLTQEIFQGLRARIPWAASNGSHNGDAPQQVIADSGKNDDHRVSQK